MKKSALGFVMVAALIVIFAAHAASFSETFAGTGALSGNWTVQQGAADRDTDRMRVQTGSFTDVIVTHATSLSDSAQYIKLVHSGTAVANTWAIAVCRFTNSSSPFYVFYIDKDDGLLDWSSKPNVAGSGTSIQSYSASGRFAVGWSDATSTGIVCDGTGTSTVVRLWDNPTADAPTDASTWDGSAPLTTLTNDPGTTVDTGPLVGVGGTQSGTNGVFFSAVYGGDFAGGGGGSIVPIVLQQH